MAFEENDDSFRSHVLQGDDEILYCRVLFPYEALDSNQLRLVTGDLIEILTCDPDEAWWSGILAGKEGECARWRRCGLSVA